MLLLMFLPVMAQEEGIANYAPAFFPELKAELPKQVEETSGLFFHNGRLWTHNDSGGKPILYALDTTTFEVVQKITLDHVKNYDWEDVCTDGETVFVGDIGNNKGSRRNLRIYTFPISAIPDEGNCTIMVDSITFRFGDQTNFEKRKHEHDFDCEAIFVTEESLYLFSKGWETGTTRLYRLPKKPGDYIAEVVDGFDSQGLITGVDYDGENHVLALVGYVNAVWKPFLYLIFDFEEAGVEFSNYRIEMPQWTGAQTEGICFFDDGQCYISTETSPVFPARVFVADFRKMISEVMERQ